MSLAVYLCLSISPRLMLYSQFLSAPRLSVASDKKEGFSVSLSPLSLCFLHLNHCSSLPPVSSVCDISVCVCVCLTHSKSGCVTQKTIHKAYFILCLYDYMNLVLFHHLSLLCLTGKVDVRTLTLYFGDTIFIYITFAVF